MIDNIDQSVERLADELTRLRKIEAAALEVLASGSTRVVLQRVDTVLYDAVHPPLSSPD